MVTTVGLERKSRYSSRTRTKKLSPLEIRELAVFCPKCKDLEVLWFVNGQLVQTRKFTQYGEKVYHDCGSETPCRLYRFS
jgi:phage FluMu protein Com